MPPILHRTSSTDSGTTSSRTRRVISHPTRPELIGPNLSRTSTAREWPRSGRTAGPTHDGAALRPPISTTVAPARWYEPRKILAPHRRGRALNLLYEAHPASHGFVPGRSHHLPTLNRTEDLDAVDVVQNVDQPLRREGSYVRRDPATQHRTSITVPRRRSSYSITPRSGEHWVHAGRRPPSQSSKTGFTRGENGFTTWVSLLFCKARERPRGRPEASTQRTRWSARSRPLFVGWYEVTPGETTLVSSFPASRYANSRSSSRR